MPLERKRHEDEEPGASRGPTVDLDTRVCSVCRREYPAWISTCPEDGTTTLRIAELPPADDPLLARFLDDDPLRAGFPDSDGDGD
ncbi:MAG TPA: hypothetical protein VHF25_04555 [Nitriliruptorales bacterium]|nr:hypothetical protein [Nitriliruptorales bacterium]